MTPKRVAGVRKLHDLGFLRVCVVRGVVQWGGLFAVCFIGLSYLSAGSDPFAAYGIDPLPFIAGVVVVGFCFGALLWLANEFAYPRLLK